MRKMNNVKIGMGVKNTINASGGCYTNCPSNCFSHCPYVKNKEMDVSTARMLNRIYND